MGGRDCRLPWWFLPIPLRFFRCPELMCYAVALGRQLSVEFDGNVSPLWLLLLVSQTVTSSDLVSHLFCRLWTSC